MKNNKVFRQLTSCCLTTLTSQIATLWSNCLRAVSHRFTTTGLSKQIRILLRGLHNLRFVQVWEYIINDHQTLHYKDYQMSFLQTQEGLKEFKNFLEKCFKSSYNASFNAEISEYAIDIADFEEISLNEAKDKIQKTAEQLRQTLTLLKEIANSESLLNDPKIIDNFYKQITHLINDNWLYILPNVKEQLRKIYYEIDECYQSFNEEVEFVIVTESKQEIDPKETKQEDLQIELEESFKNFFNSMRMIIEEEEITRYEIREADAAKEEAEREGYTDWQDI